MNRYPKIILVADDDLDDQQLLEEAFTKVEEETAVHTVFSGVELIDYLSNCTEQERPHLIVLDYNMPNMNGAQTLDYLSASESYRHIPAVVWSTSDSAAYKKTCEEKGAKFYFRKPDNFSAMREMVEKMLAYCKT